MKEHGTAAATHSSSNRAVLLLLLNEALRKQKRRHEAEETVDGAGWLHSLGSVYLAQKISGAALWW